MPMAGDNGKNKKGFSGLSDLASEISDIDEPIKPEPKAEAKPSTHKQQPQPQRQPATSETEQKSTSSSPPIETVSSGKGGGASVRKWILGVIGVVFVIVIWLLNFGGQSNKKSSYNPPSSSQSYSYPQSSPAPTVKTPSPNQSTGLQYTKPSVGTNNLHSVPEIRWCIREGIRIEAMRDVIDTNEGIDDFNSIVNNYNSRCGSYRYRKGSLSRAKREVESFRTQIIANANKEAKEMDRLNQYSQRSNPSDSTSVSLNQYKNSMSSQNVKEAQRLLKELGYDPGPVDGQYGPKTNAAVKAFQRDERIYQDGVIDQNLLELLQVEMDIKNILQ